jgi:lambda family phage portal protein
MQSGFNELRADYRQSHGGSPFARPRPGLPLLGADFDFHFRREPEFLKLIEMCRDVDRHDMVVSQGVDRVCTNVVQDGIRLDCKTGSQTLDDLLEERFQEWSQDRDQVDVSGNCNWHEIERLSLRHMLVDGDVLLMPTDDGQLQTFEAHRLRTPTNNRSNDIRLGIKRDKRKRVQEYWISKNDVPPNQSIKLMSDVEKVRAFNPDGTRAIFHLFRAKRLSQFRGVSAFVPILDGIGMHDDLQFNALVQQQITSCVAFLEETAANAPTGMAPTQLGNAEIQNAPDATQVLMQKMFPGMHIKLGAGKTIKTFAPNLPAPSFFQHSELILTFFAINLGLPLCILLLDPTKTNFSGWRGAVEEARKGFSELQQLLIERLHRPTWQWLVSLWLQEKTPFGDQLRKLSSPKKINPFAHQWNPPRWAYIEPLKDRTADALAIKTNQTSPRRLHASRGSEWYEVARETVEDNAFAIREAKRTAALINSEFEDGQPVHWRELIALAIPDGMQIVTGQDNGSANQSQDGSQTP